MSKNQIRQLKSHFGVRWAELRYWQKTSQHRLCLENKFILSQVLAGPVVAPDCLGEVYQGLIDVDTSVKRSYNTVLLINNMAFKYKTIEQLAKLILSFKSVGKRIIVNFNFNFLIYDRLKYTPAQLLEQLEQLLCCDFTVNKKILLHKITNHGFGNVFLSLDRVNE